MAALSEPESVSSSSSEDGSDSQSSEVPELTWGFTTITANGSKMRKVGFICSYMDDDEWVPVRHVSRVKKEAGSICVRFSDSRSNKGMDAGCSKEVVELECYVAPKGSVWQQLEDITNAEDFIQAYLVIQETETRQDSAPDSDHHESAGPSKESDPFEFPVTPNPRKQPSLHKSPNPNRHGMSPRGKDKSSVRQPELIRTPEHSKSKQRVNTPRRSRKNILKRSKPTESSSESEEDGKPKGHKRLKKKKSQVTTQNDFRSEVSRMRAKHPELEGAREDQTLEKANGWWRKKHVLSVTGLSASGVNSKKGVHMTVATLSKRCYRLAEGIMDKWEAGEYDGQRGTEVRQSIFYDLVGLKPEQVVFDLLQKFHEGQLRSKREFEQAIGAIKNLKKKNEECQQENQTRAGVDDQEREEWLREKAQLTSEVENLKKKNEECQQESQTRAGVDDQEREEWLREKAQLTSEVENLKKKIEECQQESQTRAGVDDQEREEWLREKAQLTSEVENLKRKNQQLTSELEKVEKEKEEWGRGNHATSESEDKEHVNQSNKPELKQVKVGEWIAVWYSQGKKRTWYPGKVLKAVTTENTTNLEVDFLTYDRSGVFRKPKVPDINIVSNPLFVVGTNLTVKKVRGKESMFTVKEKDAIDRHCNDLNTL
ncbi:DNA excision repair protein ERCC-6-like [Branchiostoma belcheri]|nr:DNA excision repair protein ERCC-6-like [Branchiostoma belcheri]